MIVVDGVLFEFVDVTLRRGEHAVLDSVDATLSDHGITVIVGPSGAGKSTLLRLCNRLDIPTSGTVRFRGADVITLDPRDLRRRVGMVFQRPVVLPGTVAANVGEGDPDATAAQIEHALDQVGLSGTGNRHAHSLSGGEAQRMCVARTLLAAPECVLFDEPTSSLDPASREVIERITRDLAADGVPCVWVTHDLDQMRRLAHRLVVLVDGSVVQQGGVEAVLDSPVAAVATFLSGGGP